MDNSTGLINNTSSQNEIYFEVTETQKPFRPLDKDTTSIWAHSIPGVTVTGPDGQPRTERKYSTEICVSTGRSGAGCNPCTTQDPLWSKLDKKTQFSKKGARADFPKKVIHLLPVLDLTTNKVRILKGGNKTFENMGGWLQTQTPNAQDLRRCEWNIWKEGKGIVTSYHTVRSDATPFTITPEIEAEIKAVMEKAHKDMAPATREAFLQMITGDADPMMPTTDDQATATVPVFTQSTMVPRELVPATPQVLSHVAPTNTGYQVSTTANLTPSFAEATSLIPPKPVTPVSAPIPQTANTIEEFTVWCNSQPEFQGMGTFNNLIPVLQEKIGGVNYHVCTNEQLVMLKEALTTKLASLRAKKA